MRRYTLIASLYILVSRISYQTTSSPIFRMFSVRSQKYAIYSSISVGMSTSSRFKMFGLTVAVKSKEPYYLLVLAAARDILRRSFLDIPSAPARLLFLLFFLLGILDTALLQIRRFYRCGASIDAALLQQDGIYSSSVEYQIEVVRQLSIGSYRSRGYKTTES